MIGAAETTLQPLFNLVRDTMFDGRFIHMDETVVQVLKEKDRSPTSNHYMEAGNLPYYEMDFHPLSVGLRGMLNSISAATIDRLLKPIRAEYEHHGLSGTKPGTLLKKHIPIQAGVWDVTQPGFIEADTVAHCGNSLAGNFVWSLTMTDICTGWTECRATWNKGADGVMT